MKHVELLSPAGDLDKLKAGVLYGADAVYLSGKRYGLRAFSGNFDDSEILEGIRFAHVNNVKAYVTVNIYGHPSDFTNLKEYILFLVDCGVDALIVSDPGIFSLIREISTDIEIHISTQSSVTNAAACEFWYRAGAKRIVLARELTLDEIKLIRQQISPDIELEVFVHGAMCMTYSGRCLLSNYFTGRDANRGECSQPCRWKYSVSEVKRPGDVLDVVEDDTGTYMFSSKDMCMIEHIPELIEAGVNCFKIEGRMKGVFYVATVTKAYREAIDTYYSDTNNYKLNPHLLDDLRKTVHREFDTGFYYTRPGIDAKISYDSSYINEAKVVGVITGYDAKLKRATVEQRNKISEGEKVEIVSPKGRHFVIIIKDIRDEEGNNIESTPHPMMTYSITMRIPVIPGSFMRLLS